MAGNIIGQLFRLTSFGESHGKSLGGVIDGMPPGIVVDFEFIQSELERRKGRYCWETPRAEKDEAEFLSGIFNGTGPEQGQPVGFF